MTRVAVTGVTALVRGTAIFMNSKGILYAAEETGPLLRSAEALNRQALRVIHLFGNADVTGSTSPLAVGWR